MALSYVATGTAVFSATGAASVAPAPPVHLAGDLMIMVIGIHTSGTKTVTVPAGWTAVGNAEASGGGGTFGAAAGPSRGKLLYQVAPDTSTSAVTVTLAGTETGSVAYGIILVYRSDGGGYDIAGANGIDTTTGTPFTAAMGADPGLAAGDMLAIAWTMGTTAPSLSSETCTATGITTTLTNRGFPSSTVGNDVEGNLCSATVDSGTSSSVPTVSAAAGGTTTECRGPIVLARVRELPRPAARSPKVVNRAALRRSFSW